MREGIQNCFFSFVSICNAFGACEVGEAAISVIGKNKEFKEIHSYYRTREKNPLKKMQSVIAVACKLIRIFYTILTKGVDYDSQKMLNDIVRPEIQLAA